MELSRYFEQAKGIGVLATADAQGKVNSAIYARPHFLDEGDDNLAVPRLVRAPADHVIPRLNVLLDHAVARDPQSEDLITGAKTGL